MKFKLDSIRNVYCWYLKYFGDILDIDDEGKGDSIKVEDNSDKSWSFDMMRMMCERDIWS
jgi:hypothetical protein